MVWKTKRIHDSEYWYFKRNLPSGTEIVVAQKRLKGDPFPSLLVFDKNIIYKRDFFNHSNKMNVVQIDFFYFNPHGNGEYLTGEKSIWYPHHMITVGVRNIPFRDEISRDLEELVFREIFSSVFRNGNPRPKSDLEIKSIGKEPSELFELYQDPVLKEEIVKDILEKEEIERIKNKIGISFDPKNPDSEDRVKYFSYLIDRITN